MISKVRANVITCQHTVASPQSKRKRINGYRRMLRYLWHQRPCPVATALWPTVRVSAVLTCEPARSFQFNTHPHAPIVTVRIQTHREALLHSPAYQDLHLSCKSGLRAVCIEAIVIQILQFPSPDGSLLTQFFKIPEKLARIIPLHEIAHVPNIFRLAGLRI